MSSEGCWRIISNFLPTTVFIRAAHASGIYTTKEVDKRAESFTAMMGNALLLLFLILEHLYNISKQSNVKYK